MKQDHSGSQRSLLDVVIKMEGDQCKYLRGIEVQSGPYRSILGVQRLLGQVLIGCTGPCWDLVRT